MVCILGIEGSANKIGVGVVRDGNHLTITIINFPFNRWGAQQST